MNKIRKKKEKQCEMELKCKTEMENRNMKTIKINEKCKKNEKN